MLSSEVLHKASALVRMHAKPRTKGRVTRVAGLLIEATVPGAQIGDLIEVDTVGKSISCEVVGFREDCALAIPMGTTKGISPGAQVEACGTASEVAVGRSMFGRVVDAFGHPIDGRGPLHCVDRVPASTSAPALSERALVQERFGTGVQIVDALIACGRGQRVGIFAGAGIGKSVLVEQIARSSTADVTVVGLIGERGREVRDLMSDQDRRRLVIVAATSDRSPMERVRGAHTATAIAEYFRGKGKHVLLVIDSLSRYAMALREIGLAIGEPPATKGYPPSVFAAMPRLLERVSPLEIGGSITGFYTVLAEGDDLSDPIADSARSLLDGHIVLSREKANRGHFPAIDVLASGSRVANQITTAAVQKLGKQVRQLLARRQIVQELQSFGAYQPGQNPDNDEALKIGAELDQWMLQAPTERCQFDAAVSSLEKVMLGESFHA